MKKSILSVLSAIAVAGSFTGNALFSAYAENSENVAIDFSEIEYKFDDINLNFSDTLSILSNFSEFSYNFREQLDDNNGAVYDALSILVNPTVDKIAVTLPEPISMTLNGLPSTSDYTEEDEETFSNSVFSNCKNGIDALLLDMPEIFWLDEANLSIGVSNATTHYSSKTKKYTITIKELTFTPAYFESYGSIDGVKEYKEKLENAIADFPIEGDTRYEQLKSIHDYICNFTYYDLNSSFYSSAVGAIVEPGVVCEGYSKAFKLICDKLDIPCTLIFGNFDSEVRTAHMWNYVQMEDDNWYAVDVTWDDLDGKDGAELKYEYFLKGSINFNVKHTPNGEHDFTYLVYPELSENDYTITTTTTTSTTSSTTTTTSSSTTTSSTSTTTTSTSTTSSTSTTTTSNTTPNTSTTTTTIIIEPYLDGDLNHDEKVNIADLVYCLKAVMGESTEFSCDYNQDGYTDSFDIVLMRKLIINN